MAAIAGPHSITPACAAVQMCLVIAMKYVFTASDAMDGR